MAVPSSEDALHCRSIAKAPPEPKMLRRGSVYRARSTRQDVANTNGRLVGLAGLCGRRAGRSSQVHRPLGRGAPVRLIAGPPPVAPGPVVKFIEHSATMKFDVSRNPEFGFVGEFFIAQFGTGAPVTEGEPTAATPGFRAVRVNPDTGQVNDFLINARPGNLGGAIPWCGSGILWRIRRV